MLNGRRSFARLVKKPKQPRAQNPFKIPVEIKDRIVQFCERRMKTFEKKTANPDERFVVFGEFTGKTHEFEVFIRDEPMFERVKSPKIRIVDKDLAPEQEEEMTNGWGGFELNPLFELQDSKHSLTPIQGFATLEGTQKYSRRNSVVDPFNFHRVHLSS